MSGRVRGRDRDRATAPLPVTATAKGPGYNIPTNSVPSDLRRHRAERMRLYRKRRREGMRLVRIPLHVTEVDALIRIGRLKEDSQPEALRHLSASFRPIRRTRYSGHCHRPTSARRST